MFSDVRDTVFQDNIFKHIDYINKPGFYAFLEQKPTTIAQCGWNSGWVKDCFGDTGLNKVGSHIISCSGTSIATWIDAIAYLDLVGKYIYNYIVLYAMVYAPVGIYLRMLVCIRSFYLYLFYCYLYLYLYPLSYLFFTYLSTHIYLQRIR